MQKIAVYALLLLVFACCALPSSVSAYSYGDPNKEDVAETFKAVMAGVAAGDWKTVADVHNVRRAEIVAHFGEKAAAALDADIAAKDADATVADYKGLMVLNLNRRFTSVKDGIGDYTQAKLLLAKARATYDALKPYTEGKLDAAAVADLESRFDAALKAIGNPGLFGVGKEAANPELLTASIDHIFGTLAPLFPFHGEIAKAGAGDAAAGEPAANGPMARANRTNVGVTVGLIAAVAVIGGGAVWWARRRGLF